jgi:plasmid stabilization system protein ParE
LPRTLIIHPRAEFDIRRAVSWIAKNISAASAGKWQARIYRAVQSLIANPELWPEADETASVGIDLRVLISGRRPHVYRVLFKYDDETVNVLRVLHAARDAVDAEDL